MRTCQLGEVADFINGRAFRPANWSTDGLPIVRIENLNSPSAPHNHFSGRVDPKHSINTGDLLVSWSASLDAYMWDRGPAVLNQHIFKVAERRGLVHRDYLYYALKSVMAEIRGRVHGATMRHITKPEFEAVRIPVPDLSQREQIAIALRHRLAGVEHLRIAVDRRLAAVQALWPILLRRLIEGASEQFPHVPLSRIMRLRNEIVHPRDAPSGQATFVGLEHVEPGTGRRTGARPIRLEDITGRKAQFARGDILYGYLRPYLNSE